MDWDNVKDQWPHSQHSRFETTRHRWHVQIMGDGPDLVLIHGAGGATQSWRRLIPPLAKTHRVIAMDLPGQGFTRQITHKRCGVDAMAEDVTDLLQHLGIASAPIVAHSAGAAIALRMVELGGVDIPKIVALNAALGKFDGVAGWLFPLVAKLMALAPLSGSLFALMGGRPSNVRRLLIGTGSQVDAEMQRLYGLLAADPDHVAGTLRMMADWSLDGLLVRLPKIDTPVDFIAGQNDQTVPWTVSQRAADRMPRAKLIQCPSLGHLAHEEAPETIAKLISL